MSRPALTCFHGLAAIKHCQSGERTLTISVGAVFRIQMAAAQVAQFP